MTDALPATGLRQTTLLAETWLLLGLSLGASAMWSLPSLIDKLTKHIALAQQTISPTNFSLSPSASCPRCWRCTCCAAMIPPHRRSWVSTLANPSGISGEDSCSRE